MGISRHSFHSISQRMTPMLDVALADRGTCPRHLRKCESLGSYLSEEISAVCVLTILRRLRMAFTPRTVSARCVASSEGTHGRDLIDVDDDQPVGGQWARAHASVDYDRLGFAPHGLAPGNPRREGRIGTAASICINASD